MVTKIANVFLFSYQKPNQYYAQKQECTMKEERFFIKKYKKKDKDHLTQLLAKIATLKIYTQDKGRGGDKTKA